MYFNLFIVFKDYDFKKDFFFRCYSYLLVKFLKE